jgi:hypothetical protein
VMRKSVGRFYGIAEPAGEAFSFFYRMICIHDVSLLTRAQQKVRMPLVMRSFRTLVAEESSDRV